MHYFDTIIVEGGNMDWKTIEMAVAYERMVYIWRKTRGRHKYNVNAVRGEREIISAAFNLRYTFEKD